MKKYFIIVFCLSILVISGCTEKVSEQETDRSLLDIKERGKIIIGTDAPYGIMEFFGEDGNIIGIDADIAQEIGKEIGVEVEFMDYEWDDIFIDIKSGKLDIAITAMTITKERSLEMLFSQPYFNAGQIIIIKKDNVSISSPEDLAGKKVGAQIDTTSLEEAIKYTDKELVFSYIDNEKEIWDDLKADKIEAVIIDYIAAMSIVKEHSSLMVAGEPFTDEFYGIPTKLENKALMTRINEILRDMRTNGKLKAIEDKWLDK